MTDTKKEYQVLARKYRPKTFEDLIGQDILVRTLTNAIENDRLAHAYILTGVRGIGKTSTARIIAKCLNGKDETGNGPPTLAPNPDDDIVQAIEQGRHVDVLEMDAASRTGVGDIREIIETVQYKPAQAKYKIYIIDEVHMLSTAAFNALLKTLEEPPEHVKFIFATTEIRKVPVTVLSRCQRFDLRRVEADVLQQHIIKITDLEGGKINEDAALAIAKAADGSVRDALSLLDQALAVSQKEITFAAVEEMLGLVDKNQIYDLMDACFAGDTPKAIDVLNTLYTNGGDPLMVMQDLLDMVHWLTRLKVTPDSATKTGSETDVTRGTAMAEKLSMGMIGRAWQLLMKAIQEVQTAPRPLQAAEMILVRFCYMATLPTPQEVVNSLGSSNAPTAPTNPAMPQPAAPMPAAQQAPTATPAPQPANTGPATAGTTATALAVAPQPTMHHVAESAPQEIEAQHISLNNFQDVIHLVEQKKEMLLLNHLKHDVHLVKFEKGLIELRMTDAAQASVPQRLGQLLKEWTDERWVVSISKEEGAKTVATQEAEAYASLENSIKETPVMQELLSSFPSAKILKITPKSE